MIIIKYNLIAKEIFQSLGGKENIKGVAHCATRLRIVLKDQNVINITSLDNISAIKGTFSNGGQYQIILGTGIVNEVYSELLKLTDISDMSTDNIKDLASEQMNIFQKFLKMISDIFVPIIPAIVAGGLLMGLNNLLTSSGLFIQGKSIIEAYPQFKDIASLINTFANAAFIFLPILLGFSATKRFGGNPFLGATIGMLMVHPDLLNAYDLPNALIENNVPVWEIFGVTIQKVGYQGSVLPVLASSFILAKSEKYIRKIMPSFLDMLLTPLLAIFITGIITFTLVGPFTRGVGDLLTSTIMWLYQTLGPIGGGIFGFIYAPFVITGMHHSFIAVETQLISNISTTGGSFIFPIAAISNISQGSAALAIFFLLKNGKIKEIASASGISALLGITEPAMFGVNLKLRYPFIAAMIGSAISSAYLSLTNVMAVALGAAGIPGIISINPTSIINYIIAMIISFIITFITTIIFFKYQNKKTI